MRAGSIMLVILGISLSACDDGHPDADGGPAQVDGSPATVDGGPPWPTCGPFFAGEATEGPLLVGEREGEGFVSFEDDPMARYEWGFQGGTMILPVVGIPLSMAGDQRCFEVTLEHRPDPEAPDLFGDIGSYGSSTFELTTTVEGDVAWTQPIFDQIGDDGLDGARLLLDVTVRGASFALRKTVAIEVEPFGPDACRDLESIGGGGCAYRVVPGEGVVLSIEPYEPGPGEDTCPEPREVTVRFEPTDPETAICYEGVVADPVTQVVVGPGAWRPPAACLSGVEVGSRLAMSLTVIEAGSCRPYLYGFDGLDCQEACEGL